MTNQPTFQGRKWHWLLGVFLLTPIQLGAKGCETGIVGSEGSGGSISSGGASEAGAANGGASVAGSTASGGAGVAGSGSTNPGKDCGGLLGLACGPGQYCKYSIDAQCGAADQTGICTDVPEACPAIDQPVCGCDGVTYGNECEAAASKGVSIVAKGSCTTEPEPVCGTRGGTACPDGHYCQFEISAECGKGDLPGKCTPIPQGCTKEYMPVCGCDGNTYSNTCMAAAAGVSIASKEACNSKPTVGKDCGGLLGLECNAGEYCNYSIEAMCGAADQTGICTLIPTACTLELKPVCGCDGKIYGNACGAASAGVSVTTMDSCKSTTKTCGGITGQSCPSGQYCNYAPESQCGAADQLGTCEIIPEVCTDEYKPVCGCDDKQYPNACAAAAAGVSVNPNGKC